MPARQRVPTLWLMTDERLGDGLWRALERLPRGSGVVFRHHVTPLAERQALFAQIAKVAKRRHLILIRTGERRLTRAEAGTHKRRGPGLVTWSAHTRREAIAAVRAGAQVLFVSPVFATRSHPDARALGPLRAADIARDLPVVRIALGGMDARRYARTSQLGFEGWAAIDALA